MRIDGRKENEMRDVCIQTGYTEYAPGSVLVKFGKTRVLCTAMPGNRVPPFLEGTGRGFVTAEYAMLPSSTPDRKKRENVKNGADGRSVEISRLIGRALRCAVDLKALGERMIHIDCDVLQADGGTRTAAITGGYVALVLLLNRLVKERELSRSPVIGQVAAVSAGLVDGRVLLDLCYEEDSKAEADCNIVMMGDSFVEIQGTGERRPISERELSELVDVSKIGIKQLMALQQQAIDTASTI